ncbi:MAG TPA: YoaK family protein [Pseudolabrys sp.]|jgi:uncharacterized membrane protein YoaK (UPF0700 family)|nr:YoaK family protein [Pseudolabrys sp.]
MNEQPFQVPKLVGALLAFGAGIVDVCTYLGLFGLFVAQVTGSFIFVGAQVLKYAQFSTIHTLALPVFFAAGFGTAFLSALAGKLRTALCWTLGVEMALIAAFLVAGIAGWPFTRPDAPLALTTSMLGIAAMGVQSALVRLLLKEASTNVMTSNTTVLALDVAEWAGAAWRARRRPHDDDAATARHQAGARVARLWPILAAFFAGILFGALAFKVIAFWCALISLAMIGGVLIWALRSAPPT